MLSINILCEKICIKQFYTLEVENLFLSLLFPFLLFCHVSSPHFDRFAQNGRRQMKLQGQGMKLSDPTSLGLKKLDPLVNNLLLHEEQIRKKKIVSGYFFYKEFPNF